LAESEAKRNGIAPQRKALKARFRLMILLLLAGVASCIVIVVAATLIAWRHNDTLNAQRLRVLQADGIFHCRVGTISPWREKEEMNADIAGTTHGIGFGGRTQTSVTRLFLLNGADSANVINAFTGCAQTGGWTLAKRPYIALSGAKSFPDGWRAYLNIYLESRTSFASQPILQVSLTTDPI